MVLKQQLVTTMCDSEFSQGVIINQFDVLFSAKITKCDTKIKNKPKNVLMCNILGTTIRWSNRKLHNQRTKLQQTFLLYDHSRSTSFQILCDNVTRPFPQTFQTKAELLFNQDHM